MKFLSKFFLILSVACLSFLFGVTFQNHERDFEIRNPDNTRNIRGNIAVIGNTVLCPKNTAGNCQESPNGQSNSEANLKYVNIAGATGAYPTSSSARLNIPNNATIVWAGIYAQGYLKSKTTVISAQTAMNGQINVRTMYGNYSLSPDIVNFRKNGNYGYTYGSYYPILNMVGLKGSQINGDIVASNIRAEEGTDNSGLGNSGAWSLVVVYEDANETLKNISVFDGFKEVSSSKANVNINISGFLTPSSGTVKSSLSFFTGEGDKYITGDNLYVNGVRVNSTTLNNVMDSSIIGVPNRNPFLINNQGIDIQNHNISSIVKNNDTSATIRLTSSQDTYFPIMVAFATELYEPRVCYVYELLNEYGNETIDSVKNGDIVTIRTSFTNLPQGADAEDAKKVKITLEHDFANLQYISNSTKIKNIGNSNYISHTDTPNDDLNTFNATSIESYWNLGQGATITDGGLFKVNSLQSENLKAYVDYKSKINAPSGGSGLITINNQYKISYEDSLSGIRFGDGSPLSMSSCRALKNELGYSNPNGLFNIVNEVFSGSTNSESGKDSQNTLYTQVSDKNFTVKLLSLDTIDKKTLVNINANVSINLIETPTPYNNEACENASPIHHIGNFTLNNEKSKTLTLKYPNAKKNVSFKIINTQTNATSCSRDYNGFTIRPANFGIINNNAKLIGGKNEAVTIRALDLNGSITKGYNQTIGSLSIGNKTALNNATRPLCNKTYIDGEFTISGGNFNNGESTANVKYDNVGALLVDLIDSDWASEDKEDSACIGNSNSSTHTNGKVGCNSEVQQNFMFYPSTFNSVVNMGDFDGGTFTYISENANMYAPLSVDITAVLNNNTTAATNYHQNCWADDVTYNVNIPNNVTDWNPPSKNASSEAARFFTINENIANVTTNATTHPADVTVFSNNFVNGIAQNMVIGLNFKRDANRPQNPFTVAGTHITLTNIKDANTNASAQTTQNGQAKFYYGRAYSTDYTGSSPIPATMRYEGYCDIGCNSATYNALSASRKNPDDNKWLMNIRHNDKMTGNCTLLQQYTSTNIGIAPNYSIAMTNGREDNIQLTHDNNPPFSDDIQIHTQSWLAYTKDNADRFRVNFDSSGGDWAGVGQVNNGNKTGRVLSPNTSNITNRKIDW